MAIKVLLTILQIIQAALWTAAGITFPLSNLLLSCLLIVFASLCLIVITIISIVNGLSCKLSAYRATSNLFVLFGGFWFGMGFNTITIIIGTLSLGGWLVFLVLQKCQEHRLQQLERIRQRREQSQAEENEIREMRRREAEEYQRNTRIYELNTKIKRQKLEIDYLRQNYRRPTPAYASNDQIISEFD